LHPVQVLKSHLRLICGSMILDHIRTRFLGGDLYARVTYTRVYTVMSTFTAWKLIGSAWKSSKSHWILFCDCSSNPVWQTVSHRPHSSPLCTCDTREVVIRYRGSPVKMLTKSLTQVRQVSAGSSHTVLLTANGHVLTCGSNHVSNSTHTAWMAYTVVNWFSGNSKNCWHQMSDFKELNTFPCFIFSQPY